MGVDRRRGAESPLSAQRCSAPRLGDEAEREALVAGADALLTCFAQVEPLGLTLRDRSLVVIASLVILGGYEARLRTHLRLAR